MKKNLLGLACFCSLLLAGHGWTQEVFDLNGKPQNQTQKPQQKQGNKKQGAARSGGGGGGGSSMACGTSASGWGGSIEAGRYARAAETALKNGNPGAAMSYAQHLTEVAPNDACNWFLVGYTARLAGNSQVSLDAYQKGLQRSPNSVEGLSGMAQTYIRMGKADEAKKLLLQVIAANPRRPVDLAIAGELFMQSGDLPRAQSLLERSENIKPSSHAELLLAITYMKGKQTEKAKELLDKAMKRSPKNTEIFRAVAQFYREAHDYKSAIAILQKAPIKNADVMSELGYTYELAGMKRESADTYEKAAGMAPKSANVQLAAAQSQLRVGNLDKTRTFLTRAEQIDPNYYRLHAIRGDLAKIERRDNDAVREYLAALAAMPQGPAEGILYPTQLRLNLIDTYRDLDDDAASRQQIVIAQQELAKIQVAGADQVEYLRLRAALKGLGDDFSGAEADLKQALQLDPQNDNVTLQYGSLLWKMGRRTEARQMYTTLLKRDEKNRYALEALGYLSRDDGDNKAAEGYFTRMAAAYPNDYVPYMALGDLYTAMKDYTKAEASYEKAHSLAPTNSQIVAGGSNAAIDAGKVDLAGQWVARATGAMKNDPRIMRETERYLFLKGKYAESARLGEQAVQKLPHDRDAAVYLGYDYYNLGRYDEVLALASRYETVLPREANFPLLIGHVHKQNGLLQQAIDDFSRALEKDPKMFEAMVNRGYVRNDMQDAQGAIHDFEPALKMNPDSGVARLGLAFSYLQLHRSREALEETNKAEKLLGQSGATHMARATAYRQMRVLDKAVNEYRIALKYAPDDLKLHEALADALYHGRRYGQAIDELQTALQLSPDDPLIYANLASAHAQLGHRAETFKYIQAAEREAVDQSAILLATGEALMTLGDHAAANERFIRALDAPDANRVDVRMEFAKLFVKEGKLDDAKQEVGLAFAEARIGESSPITADNLVEAGNIFLAAHDFDLAERYFAKSRDLGAGDDTVAIGLAYTYIAKGDDRKAAEELTALGNSADYQQSYDYQLAWGNIYSQRHDNVRAISAFARANELAEDDPTAERGLLQVSGQEGTPLPRPSNLNIQSYFSTGAIFDDPTLYEMDNKFFGAPVPPRYQQETDIGAAFRYHPSWPLPINGFVGVRNYRGTISIPSELAIVNRNTYDTVFNVGTTAVLPLGNARVILSPGLQGTIRRDTDSPLQMNQNLFRQYLYLNTSPFFNWLTIRGDAVHESGPFTEQNLHSRDLGATLEFEVGRPWGQNSFVTGYSVRDLLFRPLIREFYTTSTWAGVEHKFGQKTALTILGKYIRSWRVQDLSFATAQAMVPGVRYEYKPNERWSVDASFDLSRGQGFHLYDNVQSGFLISYMKPLRRSVNDGSGELAVDYPLRFSVGLQQQSFYEFSGAPGSTFSLRPVIQISIF
ncbi:MAG TPA: tetratricopeptide repeat protein [Candidatus Angelobacter sp.]|nr:tetratricopeptide repeat protein [Candidatus Angelobacter sp.]